MSIADDELLASAARTLFWEGRRFDWNLVSTRLTQFSYFDRLLGRPAWRGRKVLDFGGNVGTFLAAAGDRVEQEDYWCVDINAAVVEHGRLSYPRAHFVHYDRYSSQYNPRGVRNLPVPDVGVEFDFVLAFSVFTHTDRREMVDLVGSLRRMLAPGGVLAFTFLDPHFDRSLSDPTQPPGSPLRGYFGGGDGGEMEWPGRWYVCVDDTLYIEPGDELCQQRRAGRPLESYVSFFTADYVASLFPGAEVFPPASPEWQHCCILRSAGARTQARERASNAARRKD